MPARTKAKRWSLRLFLLADLEPAVRVAAAEALTNVCSDAVSSGSANKVVAHAVIALIGSLKDPERSVREAAANGLGSIASLKGADDVIDCRAVIAALAAMLAIRIGTWAHSIPVRSWRRLPRSSAIRTTSFARSC